MAGIEEFSDIEESLSLRSISFLCCAVIIMVRALQMSGICCCRGVGLLRKKTKEIVIIEDPSNPVWPATLRLWTPTKRSEEPSCGRV